MEHLQRINMLETEGHCMGAEGKPVLYQGKPLPAVGFQLSLLRAWRAVTFQLSGFYCEPKPHKYRTQASQGEPLASP